MTPDEAYEEALRRIREAEKTGAFELDLSGMKDGETGAKEDSELAPLNRLPRELERLTSLQTLDLSFCGQLSGDISSLAGLVSLQTLNLTGCTQLSDLSPLASLTSLLWLGLSECINLTDLSPLTGLISLQTLNLLHCENLSDLSPLAGLTTLQSLSLYCCEQLSDDLSPLAGLTSLQELDLADCYQLSGDLSPLAGLTSLQSLNLSRCGFRQFAPLESLLPTLKELYLFGCELPSEVCGEHPNENVLDKVRAHYAHLEEAYKEALRRIREAETTGSLELSLSGLALNPLSRLPRELTNLTSLQELWLNGCEISDLSPLAGLTSLQELSLSECQHLSDLSPLAGLTSLQKLNLYKCRQLSDLSPLASLTSLQWLNLSRCGQISDLTPLAGLTSLQTLQLSCCSGFRRFAPLESLLPMLKELRLFDCELDDLPAEFCGEDYDQNVLIEVRAHYADLQYGARQDAALKVFFLGNGGVGKTQLCRRLRRLKYNPKIPTTHGIQLGEMTLRLDGFSEPVRLNLWDFGGQDIYHGSHALFLQGQAIFLILWTPDLEQRGSYKQSGVIFRHRPLSYWIDYLRAFAGKYASMLIIQSQCDTRDKRILHPPAPVDDFPFHRFTEVSSRTGLNLGILKEYIKEAVRDRFNRFPPNPIGEGRVKVRDRLRQMLEEDQKREPDKRRHRLLEREEFDRLCGETGMVSDSGALLDFLHRNGVVFYRTGLFGDRIVLDQNWALEAIYALFERKKIQPMLRGYGRFCRADLEALIWFGHTPEEQNVFLGMMEDCGICFRVRELPYDPIESSEIEESEWEYLAPELLPGWSGVQELLLGRLRDDPPDAEASGQYAFLHEGILRGYLSKLGEHAKDAAIYWKYGCWFFEQKTRSQVLIESKWEDDASEAGAGDIRFRAWGERADDLIEQLLRTLQTLPIGQPPEIKRVRNATVVIKAGAGASLHATVEPDTGRLDNLEIPVRHELPAKGTPEIFVSFAWGDDSSEDARQRTEIVDRLCETLGQHGWHILRDSTVLHPGDLISGFMKRIGLADHVIVVLSDKYLRSPYCMTELHSIYQRSVGEKEEFLRRIIPLRLADARFSTWRDRVAYAEHWETEFKAMEGHLSCIGQADFRLYQETKKWYVDVGDMLAYVNDVLTPHGFDEIVQDEFAALRQMLQQCRI